MKVKKAFTGSLISRLFRKKKFDLSPEFRNLNLTSRASTSSNQQKTPQVQVMDVSQVKTMYRGGSVEIGKGKDYIKNLL